MSADEFLVARSACGCVQCVQLPTRNAEDVRTFRAHYPHATVEYAWPRVRCQQHPAPGPSGNAA